ncbi:hypothetical protein NRB_05560 [Novosphingobium sp. 11B]
MAQIAKKTKRYPSDLADEEWDRLAPLMPKPGRRGRPREVDFREVINAVRYLVRSGCGWRMLPIHFGAWQTVYGWFRELARRFLFHSIHPARPALRGRLTTGLMSALTSALRSGDEPDDSVFRARAAAAMDT